MDKFTKINLNGEVKFVSAIFDGSGNEIEATYETKENVSEKESELLNKINIINTDIDSLKTNIATIEAYKDSIDKNTESIETNKTSINSLNTTVATLQNSLDSVTIKAGTNENSILTLNETTQEITETLTLLLSKIGTLEAIVNDEELGINALNTQADQNTADIAVVLQSILTLTTEVNTKISLETFNALLARVESLELALQTNHPESQPAD